MRKHEEPYLRERESAKSVKKEKKKKCNNATEYKNTRLKKNFLRAVCYQIGLNALRIFARKSGIILPLACSRCNIMRISAGLIQSKSSILKTFDQLEIC